MSTNKYIFSSRDNIKIGLDGILNNNSIDEIAEKYSVDAEIVFQSKKELLDIANLLIDEDMSTNTSGGLKNKSIFQKFEKSFREKTYDRNLRFYEKAIINATSNVISICDFNTHHILYLNQSGRELFGIKDDSEFLNTKCYEFFYGLSQPCSFCANEALKTKIKNKCKRFIDKINMHFFISTMLINIDNRDLVIQIAVDIDKDTNLMNRLDERVKLNQTIFDCIKKLSESDDLRKSITDMLEIVCKYHDGTRGFIFEKSEDGLLLNNTYEWCQEGVPAEIQNLQSLDTAVADSWFIEFEEKGTFFISDLYKNLDPNCQDYKILKAQGIKSLMAAPLMENGVCNGFIGVDNPINFLDDFQLLSSVGYFTVSHIQKRRLIDNLEKLSYIDDLTQLFNRNKYIEDITELEKNIPESLGVVFLDLNGLKIANDKFGHDYGDVILKKVAKLLMRIFKKNHNIYRIGGDEFIIFSPNISKKSFYTLTERLRTSVGEGKDISASIGTTWGNNDYNVCDLIKHADDLMYANKQSFYHSAKFGDYNYSSLISKNLIKDIENGKYVVYLQPKIDLATDTLCGAEALIRGIGKDGKLIPPNSFIPVLESNGLIRHIDFFVFETACKLLNDFDKTSTDLKSISVNFSRVTLLEHGIVNSLVEICKRCHVSPSNIIIEVTESTTHLQVEELISLVYKIKDAGFNVSLDDYGTKYSNMIVLSNVGFDEIKLDRSMIRELTFNSKTKTIIEYTIKMLKELKKCNVVAEGIETPEELDLVKTYGCDLGQGFHFSRPISIEDFTKKYITD